MSALGMRRFGMSTFTIRGLPSKGVSRLNVTRFLNDCSPAVASRLSHTSLHYAIRHLGLHISFHFGHHYGGRSSENEILCAVTKSDFLVEDKREGWTKIFLDMSIPSGNSRQTSSREQRTNCECRRWEHAASHSIHVSAMLISISDLYNKAHQAENSVLQMLKPWNVTRSSMVVIGPGALQFSQSPPPGTMAWHLPWFRRGDWTWWELSSSHRLCPRMSIYPQWDVPW